MGSTRRVVASKDFNLEKNGSGMKLSFADLLKGKDMESSKITIKAKEDTFVDGNDWLLRSVIGKLPFPPISGVYQRNVLFRGCL
ncbi:hypothetical protein RHGRI_000337 [Rhododendron griersonianum]|uniref:Uncharacterized protein n=1 Tax=Rhododendron griersonianum TaxID=479676 RepID=A0AAV6LG78_9ERIC|nr:hypothetical protein RHGRI_000337 [Rhododendron griersonianum]